MGGKGMALHKDTGELIWLADTNRAGPSTPILTQIEGQDALIMFCRREIDAAVSLANGAPVHRLDHAYDQNCTDPILHRGGVLVSSGPTRARCRHPAKNQLSTTAERRPELPLSQA